jgi:hypothetical protein
MESVSPSRNKKFYECPVPRCKHNAFENSSAANAHIKSHKGKVLPLFPVRCKTSPWQTAPAPVRARAGKQKQSSSKKNRVKEESEQEEEEEEEDWAGRLARHRGRAHSKAFSVSTGVDLILNGRKVSSHALVSFFCIHFVLQAEMELMLQKMEMEKVKHAMTMLLKKQRYMFVTPLSSLTFFASFRLAELEADRSLEESSRDLDRGQPCLFEFVLTAPFLVKRARLTRDEFSEFEPSEFETAKAFRTASRDLVGQKGPSFPSLSPFKNNK